MPVTQKQLRLRKKAIGGSDLAAICGVDPFRTSHDVWEEKKFEHDDVRNMPIKLGNFLEAGIINWAQGVLGAPIRRNQRRVNKEFKLAVNLDGIFMADGCPVEAKSGGLLWPQPLEWGNENTDQVPEKYIVQCHAAMLVTGTKLCWLPALLGGRGFVMFRVSWDTVLGDALGPIARDWYKTHVEDGVEPTTEPTLSVVKRRVRKPLENPVVVPDELANRLEAAKVFRAAAEKEHQQAQANVINALGEGDCGMTANTVITYDEQERTTYKPDPEGESMLIKRKRSNYRVLRTRERKDDE